MAATSEISSNRRAAQPVGGIRAEVVVGVVVCKGYYTTKGVPPSRQQRR